jgi:hypothetical protein
MAAARRKKRPAPRRRPEPARERVRDTVPEHDRATEAPSSVVLPLPGELGELFALASDVQALLVRGARLVASVRASASRKPPRRR